MVKTEKISLTTRGYSEIFDITPHLREKVRDSGVKDGIVTIFVPGATGALTTIEFEDGLVADFQEFWEKILPEAEDYHHNLRWGDGNGFSHLRASLLGPSLTVPFCAGKMTLGTWQQIIFVDFDNKSRKREIICQIMGE